MTFFFFIIHSSKWLYYAHFQKINVCLYCIYTHLFFRFYSMCWRTLKILEIFFWKTDFQCLHKWNERMWQSSNKYAEMRLNISAAEVIYYNMRSVEQCMNHFVIHLILHEREGNTKLKNGILVETRIIIITTRTLNIVHISPGESSTLFIFHVINDKQKLNTDPNV